MSTRPFRRAQTGLDREKFNFPADFGSVREGFGTCLGHLKAMTGRSDGRELSSARRLTSLGCRRAAPHRRPSGSATLRTPGTPYVLGNSVIQGIVGNGTVAASSCIACHVCASFGPTGKPAASVTAILPSTRQGTQSSVVSLNYRNRFPREIGCTLPR